MNICNKIIESYSNKKTKDIFFIGFFCGIPFLLTTSILDIWLKEYGISKTIIGFFAILHCPYTLKFLWGPIFEKVPIPYVTQKLGQYKSWTIVSQIILVISIICIASIGPQGLFKIMIFAVVSALAGGCQDMTLYTFLLHSTKKENLGILATVVNSGFKIGMFISKSSVLYIAHYFSWNIAYYVIACSLIVGIIFVFSLKEPEKNISRTDIKIKKLTGILKEKRKHKSNILTKLELIFFECMTCPAKLFANSKNWHLILLLIVFYRLGDYLVIKMGKLFYIELGFSTLDIANAVQVFGTASSLLGGVVGGYFIKNNDLKKCMLYISIIHAIVNLLIIILTYTGKNYFALYSIIFIKVATGGAMSSCFLAFLYSLCNVGSKGTQFGLLWAFHESAAIIIKCLSGSLADCLGWRLYFITSSILFIPGILILIKLIQKETKNVRSDSSSYF